MITAGASPNKSFSIRKISCISILNMDGGEYVEMEGIMEVESFAKGTN